MKSFVHLHVHSYYSLLDGMSSISDLVDKAQKDGMPAIALTDHGSMFGIKEFYDYTKKKNKKVKEDIAILEKELLAATDDKQREVWKEKIAATTCKYVKPIIGSEVYVAKRTRFDKTEKEIDRCCR